MQQTIGRHIYAKMLCVSRHGCGLCKICGAFEIVRKRGRPRDYCYVCQPVGWQVVRVAAWQEWRTRPSWWKLRRRPSLFASLKVPQ